MGYKDFNYKVAYHDSIVPEDDNYLIGDFCLITVPQLRIGSHSQINAGSKVLGRETVKIGRHTVISYDCLLLTSSDVPDPPVRLHDDFSPEDQRKIRSAPITIGDFCYIGAKCILMPGVSIPDSTVIPAMSYVDMRNGELRTYAVKNTNKAFEMMMGEFKKHTHKVKVQSRRVKKVTEPCNNLMYQ